MRTYRRNSQHSRAPSKPSSHTTSASAASASAASTSAASAAAVVGGASPVALPQGVCRRLVGDGGVCRLHAPHMRHDERKQLVVDFRVRQRHVALLERVALGVVKLASAAEARVTRDRVVRHVTTAHHTNFLRRVLAVDTGVQPVAHVSVGGEVALVHVDQLGVQVAARPIGRIATPIDRVIGEQAVSK